MKHKNIVTQKQVDSTAKCDSFEIKENLTGGLTS